MIDKLKKKIFWIIQISLSVIILGSLVIFASFSYKNTITSSTMLMERIEGKGSKAIEFDEHQNNQEPFEVKIEGVYRIRVNKNNTILKESDDVSDEIKKYVTELNNKISEEGFIENYIYKIRRIGNNVKEITLIENSEVIKRLKITLIYAVAIGFLGIIITYIISKKIANIIVKPVENTFERQKQFVSDASHELKTPLAVIEANSDVLQNKVGENKWITYIKKEVQSMNKLVNDLLILARMENTNNFNNQKFDLSKEAQMSVAVFESMMYEKKIKLETNIDEAIEFNGDKGDINQIISILIDNAIKHTDENNKIVVNVEKEKTDIKIEVKNQGEPIPKEEQEKIFERFYRVDKARSHSEKRYGLGLSIAKGIVDKYNGTIKASSQDGWTSFVVKIK